MTVPATRPGPRPGTLHITADTWAAAGSEPASFDAWVARLGGSHAATVAVRGAINHGRLVAAPGGLYAPPGADREPAQLSLFEGAR